MGCLGRLSDPTPVTNDTQFDHPAYVAVDKPSDDGAWVITKDAITLDHRGGDLFSTAILQRSPDQFTGRGIVIRNVKNVTIKNTTIRGFKIAIYAENSPNLTIENCDVSNNYRQRLKSTPEKEDESDWLYGHENDNDEWLRYGAGIFLKNCDNASIKNCRARNGQNGICLVRCDEAVVTDCDMSFMSGWGLAMWRSSKCKIIGNRFDYCVRGYSHGVYARGQDSTGILVYEQCSDNIFAYNHATHGGDGFFLYAGNETVNKTGEGGCNRNLVYENDFSFAVANGIEATFSDQNVFVGNKLISCDHGIWAGYSTRTLIAHNEIKQCKNGVSIEHGRDNQILFNELHRCDVGTALWWDEDRDLVSSAYAKAKRADSTREDIGNNHFFWCKTAVRAVDSTQLAVHGNDFSNDETILAAAGRTSLSRFDLNKMDIGRIVNKTPTPIIGERNKDSGTIQFDGAVELSQNARAREIIVAKYEEILNKPHPHGLVWALAQTTGIPTVQSGPPQRVSSRPLLATPSIPEGKQHILIDEWGPYDFSSPKLTPQSATCWGTSKLRILGTGQPFKVESLSAGISASPMSGVAPAEITLRGADPNSSMIPYDVTVSLDGKPIRASGTLWQADWAVVYHTWDGSTDPRKGEEFWRRGRNFKPPILKENRDRIDFHWGGGGPTPDVKDHFALVTTATLTMPAGQWRLRTISDDGVRVYFDKKKVIDNWTWHIPTEDKADVNASEGPHDIRIEYFEIDGNAQLQFLIEPVPPTTSQPAS